MLSSQSNTSTNTISSNKKFKWTKVEQKAFKNIKQNVAHNNLLSYTDLNKYFEINTDVKKYPTRNDYQITFHSRKLNKPRKIYTVIEKYIISMVKSLKNLKTLSLLFNRTPPRCGIIKSYGWWGSKPEQRKKIR